MSIGYTDAELISAVNNSKNIADVLRCLNLSSHGGNYRTITSNIRRLNISLQHFTSKKGKSEHKNRKFSLEEIMIQNSTYTSIARLKANIIKRNIIEYKCVECSIVDVYNGKKIVLHLDHINGINNDHRIQNLRFLCPNCHSQTNTYAGKNKNRNRKQNSDNDNIIEHVKKSKNKCLDCSVYSRGKRCKKCAKSHIIRQKKINWPPLEILLEKLETMPFTTLAKELGVSDNAIRSHINRNKNK